MAPPPAQLVQDDHPDMSSILLNEVAVEGIVVVVVVVVLDEPETLKETDELKTAPDESQAFTVMLCEPELAGILVFTDAEVWL